GDREVPLEAAGGRRVAAGPAGAELRAVPGDGGADGVDAPGVAVGNRVAEFDQEVPAGVGVPLRELNRRAELVGRAARGVGANRNHERSRADLPLGAGDILAEREAAVR